MFRVANAKTLLVKIRSATAGLALINWLVIFPPAAFPFQRSCVAGAGLDTVRFWGCSSMSLDSVLTYMAPFDATSGVYCSTGKNAVVDAVNDGVRFYWYDKNSRNSFGGYDKRQDIIFVQRNTINRPQDSGEWTGHVLMHEGFHRLGYSEEKVRDTMQSILRQFNGCFTGITF